MKIFISLIALFLLSSCSHITKHHNSTSRHYVVVNVDVTDVEKYDKFIALEIPILKNHEAFIAMDIHSEDHKKRYIIVSFPDKETVGKFVKSDEFKKILPLNKESSTSTIFHGKLQ